MSEPSDALARPAPAAVPSLAVVPPAFVIAIAIMLAVGISLILFGTYAMTKMRTFTERSWTYDFWMYGRSLLWAGSSLATTTLMLVGFGELVRRSGPSVEGHVLRVGMVAILVMLALSLAGLYANYWWLPRQESGTEPYKKLETFWLWRARIAFAVALVTSGALVAAGRRNMLVLALAIPLLLLTMMQFPTRWISEIISYDRPRGDTQLWTQAAIEIAIRIGFCGMFIATVSALAASLPPAPNDMVRAGQGLERVGSGLVARVIVLLVAAFTLVMTVGAQSPSMARVAGVIFPTCLLLASLAIVTGMLRAAGPSGEGAPRLRLYTGAALSLMAMTIDALRALALYMALRRGGSFDDSYSEERVKGIATALPYLTPVIAVAGLVITLSAAVRLRRMVPEARVDEAGIHGAIASVIIFTGCGVGLLRWAQEGMGSAGTFIVVSILVAVANIVAQLSVARVCHRVGAAMREVSVLPTAVATVK